jgi:hypothetical protein
MLLLRDKDGVVDAGKSLNQEQEKVLWLILYFYYPIAETIACNPSIESNMVHLDWLSIENVSFGVSLSFQ